MSNHSDRRGRGSLCVPLIALRLAGNYRSAPAGAAIRAGYRDSLPKTRISRHDRPSSKERLKSIGEGESEAKLEIIPHDQIPFYSCYIFDDNAYVSPYPFVRAGGEVPVYAFFRSSKEYERLVGEVAQIRDVARQMRPSAAGGRPAAGQ